MFSIQNLEGEVVKIDGDLSQWSFIDSRIFCKPLENALSYDRLLFGSETKVISGVEIT